MASKTQPPTSYLTQSWYSRINQREWDLIRKKPTSQMLNFKLSSKCQDQSSFRKKIGSREIWRRTSNYFDCYLITKCNKVNHLVPRQRYSTQLRVYQPMLLATLWMHLAWIYQCPNLQNPQLPDQNSTTSNLKSETATFMESSLLLDTFWPSKIKINW